VDLLHLTGRTVDLRTRTVDVPRVRSPATGEPRVTITGSYVRVSEPPTSFIGRRDDLDFLAEFVRFLFSGAGAGLGL
jgi:hypothetical protein